MRVSLNASGVGAERMSILDYADLAARHEFDGIDIPSLTAVMRTAQELGGASGLKVEFANKGVVPVIFGLAPEMGLVGVEWRKDEETFRQSLGGLADIASFAEELGIKRCYTYLPPAVNANPDDFGNLLAARLAEMARLLSKHQIRLGLEWLGPHHLRAGGANSTGANPFIFTMAQTLKFIEKIGVPSVGLILDSLHCYTTGLGESGIAAMKVSQIVHVHLSDVRKGRGRSGARADERMLPGEGEVDLVGFVRGLRTTGYEGYVAVEVIASRNIADTPDEAAAKIRSSLRALAL
ncbi:MAG TPA: sugar phosphate isomerase/epimerase [Terriglobales bacterium]|nr:sugar phosphate isomerase/epimerase [Terriglobales bacterium]